MKGKNVLQTIDISKVRSISSVLNECAIADDFIMGEVDGTKVGSEDAILDVLRHPVRFDGYIMFYVRRGHFSIDFNLDSYEVKEHSLLVTVPGNIIRIQSVEESLSRTEIIFVMFSKEFISSLKVDFDSSFTESLKILETPCITLDDQQRSLAMNYLSLAREVVALPLRNKKEVIGGLLSSLSYLTEDVWRDQISRIRSMKEETSPRLNQLFDRFISLVNEYHCSERGMAFYAERMCLTPKYLSRLVREASGRSAPEWIDAFVVLEAKNMLRYSDKNIKQIVYDLNFPTMSGFHKFFKAQTGMSPSDYRKSVKGGS